ncbi:MAG: TIGR00266 family protein [Gemmatimonadaceae bacterium]|nr:TIGR00266 family protein [Gemmatimonadaceae bacterium]
MTQADQIDYKVIGDDLQAVIVTLDPGEAVVAEAGAMMYMEDGISMATTLDATGRHGSLLGKLLAGGKRILSGDSFFVTLFANEATRRRDIAFSSPFPGKILPVDLTAWGGTLLCQKDSFLCGARGIDVTIAFTRRIGAGFFGGEGFILQRLVGDGLCFLHASGTLHTLDLAPGETVRVDTGCLVAMQPTVDYDIQMVPGIKTALFGGEGLFFAWLTGPGRVVLQTLPFSRLADRIIAASPRAGGSRQGEGSVLGVIGDVLNGSR